MGDAALRARVTTGVAPDGKVSPTPSSTRFNSNRDWVETREAGLREISHRRGIDLNSPPPAGTPLTRDAVVEHRRPIDDGFVGLGAGSKVPHPANAAGKAIKTYPVTQPISGLTRTRTTVAWDPALGRWKVVQHFPEAKGWDQALGRYTVPPPP